MERYDSVAPEGADGLASGALTHATAAARVETHSGKNYVA
jgi:hypothetical protein